MIGSLLVLALVLGPVQAYNEGNRLYAQKDYAGAVRAYEEALKSGHDPRTHYNLGNALFRTGRIGEAIVHYRRAYYLAPRDHDVETNLAFARAYRVDKSTGGSSPLAVAAERALRWLSRREATVLAGVLFSLAGLALSAWVVWRGRPLAAVAGVLALLGLYGFLAQQLWAAEVASRPAVVVVAEVSAASGPGEEFKQVLLLHDGTEVKIREVRGEWLLVQLPGGSGGWLRQSAIECVYL
jgi:tetratricopeptide (TPR) repeat protein